MAQFTAQGQGRLKPLGVEPKDPYHCYKFGSGYWPRFQSYSPKLGFLDSNKLYFTSLNTKSNRFRVQARLNVGDKGIYDDDVHAGDDEFEMDELACFRGLVLDISYRPVNVVCWRRAICLEFMEKADVLEYYDQTVNSPSGSFYIPAVLRVPHLLQVVKRRRIKNNLSRKNIFYRDNFTCQYCSSCQNLTVDHVLPIARGGEWKWENLVIACTVAPVCKYRGLVYIQFQLNSTRAGKVGSGFTPKENVSNDKVTACAKCNSKKGQKTLEEANMKLSKVPKAPKDYDILAIPLTNTAIKMLKMRNGTPEEWRQYLSKSSSEP